MIICITQQLLIVSGPHDIPLKTEFEAKPMTGTLA
jgi:hypothetical protein